MSCDFQPPFLFNRGETISYSNILSCQDDRLKTLFTKSGKHSFINVKKGKNNVRKPIRFWPLSFCIRSSQMNKRLETPDFRLCPHFLISWSKICHPSPLVTSFKQPFELNLKNNLLTFSWTQHMSDEKPIFCPRKYMFLSSHDPVSSTFNLERPRKAEMERINGWLLSF